MIYRLVMAVFQHLQYLSYGERATRVISRLIVEHADTVERQPLRILVCYRKR